MKLRHLLLLLLAMCAGMTYAQEWDQEAYEASGRFYLNHLDEMEALFDDNNIATSQSPAQYAMLDIDGDNCYEIIIRTASGDEGSLFSCGGGKLHFVAQEGFKAYMGFVGNRVCVGGSAGTGCAYANYWLIENSVPVEAPFMKFDEYNMKKDRVETRYVTANDENYSSKKAKAFFNRTKGSDEIDPDNLGWQPLSFLGNFVDQKTDATMRYAPLFVFDCDINKNWFKTLIDPKHDGKYYDRLIFKPHVNEIVYDRMDQEEYDQFSYVFKLKDKNAVKKMFRGYKSGEVWPIAVPKAFLNDHNSMQFSRWKSGEQIVKMSSVLLQKVSERYGGRAITDCRWMATCETNERMYYIVVLAEDDGEPLAALVCFVEGEIISSWEQYGHREEGEDSVWFMGDEGDYWEHVPEIQAMMATPQGYELYIHQYSSEGEHGMILREMGKRMMMIADDYHYIMAY